MNKMVRVWSHSSLRQTLEDAVWDIQEPVARMLVLLAQVTKEDLRTREKTTE